MTDLPHKNIVDLLIEHEEAMATLYRAFRELLPEMESFWDVLQREESAHAEVLRMLNETLEAGDSHLDLRKFNQAAILTTMEHVERVTEEAFSNGTTPLHALSMALDCERSALERNFFEVFASDSNELKKDFEELRAHEEQHFEVIEERLATERE